ncbi:porin family protein [Chitinophaga arvensicola]|uniref:Outer membrane protein beta-barrel domain-containing protein n=1 Tax=Chitinophaga arvensicola TaxID=29529 RepID=A0A1I0P3C7_9BACT|nr:porin family protein [Chitinophaga arvensicola]SEW08548.1 Outer membrane protein beta-barrel domain-containing protein [Chitinophaga arvensicola]
MQRNILTIIALLIVHVTMGQVRFGLKAGFTGANMKLDGPAYVADNRKFMLPAFQGGGLMDIPLTKWLTVQPALLYSIKGYRTRPESDAGNWYFIARYGYNYLELPVNFLYKGKVGAGKIFAGLGPSVAYGIGGKVSFIKDGTKSGTAKILFDGKEATASSTDDVHANRVDIAANFLVGYEFSPGFLLSAGYAAGLLDVSASENTKQLHRSFNISFGYLFPRK